MASTAKVKVAGVWAGVIELELDNWTLPMLRQEVADRSNTPSNSINLICAGKVLKDADSNPKLSQLGLKNNSKILATRVSLDEAKRQLIADEERDHRLSRLKAAVTAMSKRHADGSLPVEDFNLELEDQSGKKMDFSETDKQAIMMGLMLHTKGKGLIRRQLYKDALEVLTMGEEAFSLCNPKTVELVDNIPILQIDMVWCYFMLRDIAWLTVAGVRLERAREGLERAHGKDSSRFRLLQAGRSAELALYLRLELLEGVVAYHNGYVDKSKRFLISAQNKFLLLEVPDEALSIVMGMGFKEKAAKRALRMSNQDVQSAINFLVEEKAKRAQKLEDDIRRRDEILEQKRYGLTPLKKAVDLEILNELVSIGFEKELGAEALRRNENDFQKALDELTNPETNNSIQSSIESKKRKRQQRARDSMIERLVSMGFPRSLVVEAAQSGGAMEQVMNRLLQQSLTEANNITNAGGSVPANDVQDNANDAQNGDDAQEYAYSDNDGMVEGSSAGEVELRDVEMEDEIADEIARGDAWSDYDIEITKEGEAIHEYLAMVDSVGNGDRDK